MKTIDHRPQITEYRAQYGDFINKITKTQDPTDQVDPGDIDIDNTLINLMPKPDIQSTVILDTIVGNKQPHKLPPLPEGKSIQKVKITSHSS